MDELIQVVDETDKPIRGASINDVHKHGWRHRVVYALIRDVNGRVLVQHRGENTDFYPGLWGMSAAGYVFENERYDIAIMRKMAEELGLSNLELREVATYLSDETHDHRKLKQVNKVFEAHVEADTELRIDPSRVVELRWVTPDELKAMQQDNPDGLTPGLHEVISRYL